MKFMVVKTPMVKQYVNDDRILLGSCPMRLGSPTGYYLAVAKTVRSDFNLEDEIPIARDTSDSIQIRPKLVYKDKNGFYMKNGAKTRLNKQESALVEAYICAFREQLCNKVSLFVKGE